MYLSYKLEQHSIFLVLTHLPLVPYICIIELSSIGSGNGSLPVRRQAITWTTADLLSIGHLKTNFSEIQIKIRNFSFMKMHLKMSSAKWQPFCPRGDELSYVWSQNAVAICLNPTLRFMSEATIYALSLCNHPRATRTDWLILELIGSAYLPVGRLALKARNGCFMLTLSCTLFHWLVNWGLTQYHMRCHVLL